VPEWRTDQDIEGKKRVMRIELTTTGLGSQCSTTELHPQKTLNNSKITVYSKNPGESQTNGKQFYFKFPNSQEDCQAAPDAFYNKMWELSPDPNRDELTAPGTRSNIERKAREPAMKSNQDSKMEIRKGWTAPAGRTEASQLSDELKASAAILTLAEPTMKSRIRAAAIVAIAALITIIASTAPACTGITIKPKDGSIIFARTLEFASDLKSNIIVVPRGKEYVGTAPGDKPGLRWKTKYGTVGANAFDMPVVVDGLNEKGLHVGLFYFPGFAKYQEVKAENAVKALAPWEIGTYLLGTCADAKEAVTAAKSVLVGEVVQKDMGFVPPAHAIVTDSSGASVVLEYVGGELKVHANPFGVMTNSPTFDWHMTNLSNYVTLSQKNTEKIDLAGKEVKGLGQGSGMLGLPGDFTPPSRFVRAVAFSKTALPVEKAKDGVLQAFHILNQFDIPKGAAQGVEHGMEVYDYTLWTSAADLKNLRYHFRTYNNSRIRMVDIRAVDLDAKEIRTISMQGDEEIEDVSGKAK
jgi:choloylglycine hydrolase